MGALDNLYISPHGGLTLVETKLWKNPEARREVVAQLFDYTKQIAQWDYKQLAAKAEDYLKEYEKWDKSLYDWLEEKFEDIPSEQEFIDRTNDESAFDPEAQMSRRDLMQFVGRPIRTESVSVQIAR